MKRWLISALLVVCAASSAQAADLVRLVRYKISAGDLATGIAAAEDYKRTTGVDEEYLNAIGWIARGAEMLGRRELAREYVAQVRSAIPAEKEELLTPYGAAIEVEGRLIAASTGRGAAIRYFESALAEAKATSLRSRIRKNINLLSLEGTPAPPLGTSQLIEKHRGKPMLLYFFMDGCGDCKAQAPTFVRVAEAYRGKGVAIVAVTRTYGDQPEEERRRIAENWKELYAGLADVPVVIDTEAMVTWGASATPTFAVVDRTGIVRLYTPTRLSEGDLTRAIEAAMKQ